MAGNKYIWMNDKLYVFTDRHYVEFPPLAKRHLIIERVHFDYSHIGAAKLAYKIAQEFYWPSLESDCIAYV